MKKFFRIPALATALGLLVVAAFAAAPASAQNPPQDPGEAWGALMQAGTQAYGLAQIDVAREKYAAAMVIADENFAEDDPRLLATLINFAPTLRAAGESAAAAEMLERGVALEIALYGEDHPDLMSQYPVLAAIYKDIDDYDRALELYRRSIDLMVRYYGEMHPRTVTLREYLATSLYEAGQPDQALELFGQVVLEWEQALGPSHIRQSVSYAGYAQMLEMAGRTEEAAAAQARSREIVIAWENRR
ncbi:MAG: tetratricopeptide repeat protein [Proteobacteria bacterium]|nr:tetratricopeptide repeat protein [Pseudomonadota bacterium]MDA1131930.1 tetratricopeptide repeat protein [Pseudomonadota bacterium]